MRFTGLVFGIAVSVLIVVSTQPVQAQEFRLKLHHFLSPLSHGHAEMLVPWAKTIETQSKGLIKIDIFPSMQLGGRPPQLIDQARDGVVDIVWTLPGYTPGRFTLTEVFELPFMHSSTVATNRALNEYVARHGEEFADYKIIVMHVHAGQLFHSNDPIETVGDLKDLKIRTPTRTGGWLIEAMGAVPIGAPVPQIPEMLSRKIVDAVMIPYEVTLPLKVDELVDYHTELDDPVYPRINTSTFVIAMNKATYAKLPPDLQKIIDDNSGQAIAGWIAEGWDAAEIPGRENAAKSGETVSLPPEEVAKLRAMVEQPVIDRWVAQMDAKGYDGNALVAEARALLEKHKQ
jgi:TRAP-type C4-dicarboxylate transport system substrate-binding protein